ncbi:MAG: hypothetical protein ACYDBQ_06820 [Thermoplasmatota archaeon]
MRVGVFAEEPSHVRFLEMLVELADCPGVAVADGDTDVAVVECDLASPWSANLPAIHAPFVVVCRGAIPLADVERLIREGADDVLVLGETTPERLIAALAKTVGRHERVTATPSLRFGLDSTWDTLSAPWDGIVAEAGA